MSKETSIKPNVTNVASVYGNSIPADYSSDSAKNAQTLFEWLGSFWSEIYEDPEFIENLQGARALRAAQLYLDLLENLKLQDRENAPIFHRERWHPIIIRKSQRNTGSKNMIKLVDDGTVVLGKQTHEIYPEGTEISLGSKEANYKNMVVYPLDTESLKLKDVMTCISNNIADASVILGKGTDFVILDGAIAISENKDPFTGEDNEKWSKFEIIADDPSNNDEEVVLWACDAMFDKDFIYNHLGYIMRLPGQSSEIYKRVINAAWNTVASGATPLLVKSLMASICGIPTVKEDGEVVENILYNTDGTIQVITTKNVYTFPEYSELRKDIKPGKVLKRFDTLDKAIKVYSCINDLDNLHNYNEFIEDFDEFVEDVPVIDLPPALFRADVEGGFSIGWDEVDITCVGFDYNGNPKLRFPMGGSQEDDDLYWNDIWKTYENSNTSMESILDGIEYDHNFVEGKVCGRISPMKFFMKNLIGANTIIMTVKTDTLADDAPLYDPKFFAVLRNSIPSYIRLYVIEHESTYEDEYKIDGEDLTDGSPMSYDEADFEAYEEYDEEVKYRGRGKGLKTKDRVDSKWIASCCDPDDEYDTYE